MDRMYSVFKGKKIDFSKLVPFGFTYQEGIYTYRKILTGSGFVLLVRITQDGSISSEIIDPILNERYTLHLADGAVGSFVGEIRSRYETALNDIAQQCFEPDVFKSEQAKKLIAYVRGKYANELEFLWKKFPDNAIWRRADNKKWYGALLTVSKRKLGIDAEDAAEIIDLRIQPEKMEMLIDNERYFPGWHMNKRNWYTMILDGSVPIEEIQYRIDESYSLAKK